MENSFSNFRKSSLFVLYILGLILSFRFAIPSYITSSFLSSLFGEKYIGYIFSAGSVVTLILFYFTPKILKRFGNYKTTLALSIISFITLFIMIFLKSAYPIIIFLTISSAAASIIGLCLDIFIEHDSSNIETGNIRGVYLATLNIAWLVSPFLIGLIVGESGYKKAFLIASLIMAPFIFMIFSNLKNFVDPPYQEFKIWQTIRELFKNRDVRSIMASYFILQFFYAWMVIYTPLYLNHYIGFDWISIGKIFTVMLIPFVLFEAFWGKLADRRFGEKEMLSIGFIIMAISTAAIPLLVDRSMWLWAGLLFITRVGASMVEVMTDTYFFKNIGDKDANLISLYRSMVSIVYVVAPIVATLFLSYLPIPYLFFALGFLMLFGLRYSLAIKDTK